MENVIAETFAPTAVPEVQSQHYDSAVAVLSVLMALLVSCCWRMVRTFLSDERGQDLVEYALIVAAVALAMLATLGQLAGAVDSMYQHMIGQLTGVDWSNTK